VLISHKVYIGHMTLYLVVLPMCKPLSREHKAVIFNAIEEKLGELENHIDGILGNEHVEVKQCRTAKTGKTAKKKK